MQVEGKGNLASLCVTAMATCVEEKKCFKSKRKRERERERESKETKRGRVAEREIEKERDKERDREIINGGIKGSLSHVIVIFLGEI